MRDNIFAGTTLDARQNEVGSGAFSFQFPLFCASGFRTYSEYNYLRPGIASLLRTNHFERALLLTKAYFHKCSVIDFGCADGPFLPSLARYFDSVVGIDQDQAFVEAASRLVEMARLNNTKVFCNHGLTSKQTRDRIGDGKFGILYLLETLEHIGDRNDPWGSRVRFLEEISNLVEPDGIIVVSLPVMVGLPFLAQRIGLALLGASREKISTTALLRASLLNDTGGLERQWVPIAHLGFNHRKLERRIRDSFVVVKKKNIFWQVIYVMRRKKDRETPNIAL